VPNKEVIMRNLESIILRAGVAAEVAIAAIGGHGDAPAQCVSKKH